VPPKPDSVETTPFELGQRIDRRALAKCDQPAAGGPVPTFQLMTPRQARHTARGRRRSPVRFCPSKSVPCTFPGGTGCVNPWLEPLLVRDTVSLRKLCLCTWHRCCRGQSRPSGGCRCTTLRLLLLIVQYVRAEREPLRCSPQLANRPVAAGLSHQRSWARSPFAHCYPARLAMFLRNVGCI
jgi:hypothetical protein